MPHSTHTLFRLIPLLLAVVHAAAGAVFHVAPHGQDSNPGTDGQPWKTLAKAAAAVQPGDTVWIRAGDYFEKAGWNVTRAGTADMPITYQAYGDGEVRITPSWIIRAGAWTHVKGAIYSTRVEQRPAYVFRNTYPIHPPGDRGQIFSVDDMFPNSSYVDGSTLYVWLEDGSDPNRSVMRAAASHVVNLRDCHYTIFDGLTLEYGYNGFKDHGTSTHHVTYRNCTLRSIGSQGIQPVPRDGIIEGNLFQRIGVNKYTHGIYNSKPGLIVRHNIFEEITGAAIHQFREGTPAGGNCEFYGNVFRKPRKMIVRPIRPTAASVNATADKQGTSAAAGSNPYYVEIIAWGDGNNRIHDNVFYGEGKRGGISLNSRGNEVSYNTFVGSAYAVAFHAGKPDNRVVNNVVHDATRSFLIWPANSLPQILNDNVYYNATVPARWERDGVAHQTFAAYQEAAGETKSRYENPHRLGSMEARLQPGSGAIRAGPVASGSATGSGEVAQSRQPTDDLHAVLRRRGYTFRQHLEEVGWTQRKPTVVDLDERQRTALERYGVAGLQRVLDEQGLWSFPAIDIQKPLPVQPDIVLAEATVVRAVVVAPASGLLRQLAEDFVKSVTAPSRVQLSLIDDARADLALLKTHHVVLFGGSHESRFAMDIALRYQGGFVDATLPGNDGWVVTTHVGLDRSGHNVMQITGSSANRNEVMACLRDALTTEGNRALLRSTHRIRQGTTMRAHFPTWESWAGRLAGVRPAAPGQPPKPIEPAEVAERIAPTTEGAAPPGRYNVAPVDLAVQCAQYYQRSGDRRALQLFRELLFRVADFYLKRPEGAYYPPDLDFRIGRALLYYSRLEHEPIFSKEDRLILSNLLLSCSRSIYEYTMRMWPLRPGVVTLHNHETFAARSLMYAAEYFERYGLPHVTDWRKRVDDVFAGEVWNRFKQRENANSYETYAYDHAAAYSAFNGRRLDMFDRETLRWTARRHMIATDNFFRAVDYGDTGLTMRPGSVDKLPVLFTSQYEDPALQWFAQACFDRHRSYLPGPLDGFTDLRRTYSGPPPKAGAWELLPLDARFAATEAPGFPHEYTFDKLAFRSSWDDEGHYLLFEGVGNQRVSHSHNNVNGIVRLNHLGRHLLVSNGYGRTVSNPSSFGGRVRGPEDHNNLVLRRANAIIRDLPMCSAMVQRGQSGDLAYVTGALPGYSGLDWFRTVVILSNRFVLTLDRLRVATPEFDTGHIEWNCPGEVTARAGGFRVAQKGVFLDVTSASGWESEQGVSDQSNDWKNVLESGAYPYAKWPLKKLMYKMPAARAGQSECLAVLLAATRSDEPAYRVIEPQRGVVRIEARQGGLPAVNIADADLSVRSGGATLEIRFSPAPALPPALQSWAAR